MYQKRCPTGTRSEGEILMLFRYCSGISSGTAGGGVFIYPPAEGRNLSYPCANGTGKLTYREGVRVNRAVGGMVGVISPRDGVVTPPSCVGDLVF